MSEKTSDSYLIARARRGETEAFGELYRRYFDPIFRYLRMRVAQADDAEDLAETVFLRAYQSLPRYRERGWPFSAFLYQVARNALADHYRKGRPETDLEEAEGRGTEARALDDGLVDAEQIQWMKQTLAELTPDQQEVIRLRILLGLSTRTTAAWMGRSEGAVRVMLLRALSAMRTKMTDTGIGRERG
ncbi:MAG: polymerase, sigma-24 subunit, subfamily [Anaerolineales bacterium]|nr:polymerase, sigma-24 subunit, subfamily [Anaerolineales bacterium]